MPWEEGGREGALLSSGAHGGIAIPLNISVASLPLPVLTASCTFALRRPEPRQARSPPYHSRSLLHLRVRWHRLRPVRGCYAPATSPAAAAISGTSVRVGRRRPGQPGCVTHALAACHATSTACTGVSSTYRRGTSATGDGGGCAEQRCWDALWAVMGGRGGGGRCVIVVEGCFLYCRNMSRVCQGARQIRRGCPSVVLLFVKNFRARSVSKDEGTQTRREEGRGRRGSAHLASMRTHALYMRRDPRAHARARTST